MTKPSPLVLRPNVLTNGQKGENNLSFIETSALDASNVELAFQNILTGTMELFPVLFLMYRNLGQLMSQRVI